MGGAAARLCLLCQPPPPAALAAAAAAAAAATHGATPPFIAAVIAALDSSRVPSRPCAAQCAASPRCLTWRTVAALAAAAAAEAQQGRLVDVVLVVPAASWLPAAATARLRLRPAAGRRRCALLQLVRLRRSV